jgi:hypothetical protein
MNLKETTPPIHKWLLSASPVLAILLSNSEMGFSTLFVVGFAILWNKFTKISYTQKLLWSPAIWIGLLIFLSGATYVFYHELVDTSGRGVFFVSVLNYWNDKADFWFGMGQGQGVTFFPLIQEMYGHGYGGYMMWLHHDWLQVLFELGFTGLMSLLLVSFFVFKDSLRSIPLFASVCGGMWAMTGNHVLHWGVHSLAIAFIAVYVLRMKYERDG